MEVQFYINQLKNLLPNVFSDDIRNKFIKQAKERLNKQYEIWKKENNQEQQVLRRSELPQDVKQDLFDLAKDYLKEYYSQEESKAEKPTFGK